MELLGKATHLRQGYGAPSIEGKAAMGSGERAGKRTSFKCAGARESIGNRASFKIPQLPAKMLQCRRFGMRTSSEHVGSGERSRRRLLKPAMNGAEGAPRRKELFRTKEFPTRAS
jgi:hypothetical protein